MDVDELIGRLGVGRDQVEHALDDLARAGTLRDIADKPRAVVSTVAFDGAAMELLEAVRQFHRADPLAKGLGREDLRARAAPKASPLVFRIALDHWSAAVSVALNQDLVHLHGRVITLRDDERLMRTRLEDRFRALGLQAPSADDVIRELQLERVPARRILQLLVDERAVVKIAEDMLVDRTALQKLIDDVRALKPAQERFGVREFKELTGLSRKFAVPLLEYLDSQRVTRRVGDERVIL